MAVYSAKPNGQSDYEYSLVVAPELADEIAAVLTTPSKRGLDERGVPVAVVEALIELLGPKAATSVLQVVNLAAAAGGPALSSVAAGVVELGGVAVAGAAFVVAIANQFALIADVLKNGDGRVSAVVVPNPFNNFRDTKTCPNTRPKCSSCGGKNLMCTTGSNNKCPCDEDDKCKTGKDAPDCGNPNCKGNDSNKCTVGNQKGCSCDVLEMIDVQPVIPNVGWLDTQQKYIQSIMDFGSAQRGSPANNPTCGSRELEGLGSSILLGHHQINDSSHATPREILYMMRETLCNDRCENPQWIRSQSVKATKKGSDGCEISIALTGSMEAWAVRDTHSQGEQWQDCWDSLANATDKCTDMDSQKGGHATGWVNGPDDYEFFQIGYRALNGPSSLHSSFAPSDALPQWCGDAKPKCDTCMGGGNGNRCSRGEFEGCDCEPVVATQPAVPTATNCATAIAAANIICCGYSDDTKKTCAQMMQGCGVTPNLDAICQSPVDPKGGQEYQGCGQFNPDDPIVRGTHGDDTAKCLVKTFNLKANLKYY
ncbi:hypothetical protein Hte_010403 [Hypoxylon texense]